MSTEADPNPNQNASSAKPDGVPQKNQDAAAKEAAAKALEQAKEKMTAGVEVFKKLDVQAQIYLAGLTVAVLCSFIFNVISVSVKVDGPLADFMKQHTHTTPSLTVFDAGANGKLAVLLALAGIGLWIWNFTAKKKEAWTPLALAGCAGLSALLLLVLWLRSSGKSVNAGVVNVDASMTLLGFWLPFAGTIAATVVSVKRILNPAQPPAA